MKKLTIMITILLSTILGGGVLVPATGYAQTKKDVCKGVSLSGGSCDSTSGTSLEQTIKNVIKILSFVIGATAVIMVIIGGFRYVISSGDSGATKSAKDTILFALIGLVVVALAQVIVRFVLGRVT